MSIFKKKGGQINAANVHMTEAEAALAQSDFNIEKITEIQNKFAGGAVLLVPGRIFIREGVLYKVCRKGLKKRQFFLFNDILVYGTIVAGLYSNQVIMPLSQMSVSADCFYQPRVNADFVSETDEENLDVANAFQISHANKSFHVFGQSAADKANWIANLQKHISRVAKSLLDSQQQVVTRPVWVPDSMSKECMICSTKFSAFQRKHHCRRCGRVVCSSCSPHRVSLVTGEGGVVSGVGETGGKLERTCRECFKEMTAVHNRANSIGSNTNKYIAVTTKGTPSRPPPPTVAAQIVSDALRTATTPPKEEGISPENVDTSTDTEDSDDSGNEQEPQPMLPIPAKRSTVDNTEAPRPVPKARQGLKGDATSPVPVARRSLKTSSAESSPTLEQKASNHVLGEENEPQPTPPPRKKKQMKQKLKEQQEPAVEETKTDGQSDDSPNNKKTRRKNKFKPLEDVKAPVIVVMDDEASATGVHQPPEIVEDESRGNVEDGAGDSVKSGTGNGVEDGAGDSVKSGARDDVDGEPINTKKTVTNSESQSETEKVGASEDIKERGDNSPSVDAAGKRSGRRRNKFKPSAPQN